VREETTFVSRFNLIWAVQSPKQKYLSFVFSESYDSLRHPASMAEGRIAIVTTREAGCGGREGADRRAATFADGEAVWSWRPEAGAKSAIAHSRCADDGDNKVWFTGESSE
jgi:hypothetical protein